MDGMRKLLLGLLIGGLVAQGTPARAEMIGTPELLAAEARAAQQAQMQLFLARDEVQQQMQDFGVDPKQAAERVAALTDAELQQLAQTIGTEPAGGDVLWVIGVVFIVLLILELVGVTNVFTQI